MSSREKILEAVLKNQPQTTVLPDISMFKGDKNDIIQRYVDVFKTIGGSAFIVDNLDSVKDLINEHFDVTKRIVTTLPELSDSAELISATVDPHTYEDVELAVIRAPFSVAENGAVWLTDEYMGQRIIPYICQHLAIIITAESIVPTLHEAYEKIGLGSYGFGGFIGGPSKTADIEQALVLGAHGPLSMTVFILK
ncbi:LutC/YkgG family protein [Segetibacter koreensis]|uniref:LutC/YkgG family protein n=1 Tax=Segetibacter koreensis TaxID=398037 RepID=UPI0004768BA5|nr:LUD domain-containing protein [Segetibacter koreensis]